MAACTAFAMFWVLPHKPLPQFIMGTSSKATASCCEARRPFRALHDADKQRYQTEIKAYKEKQKAAAAADDSDSDDAPAAGAAADSDSD